MRNVVAVLFMSLACVTATAPVFALEATERERAAARALGNEGNALWGAGDYEAALDRFTRALQLVPAPTLALREAECLEKLGRWVEASEKLLALGRTKLEEDAPDVFHEAVRVAWDKSQEIRKRIPSLVVVVEGEQLEEAVLTLDGEEVTRALWGVKQPVDPGTRVLVLRRGKQRIERRVTVVEAETKRIVLRLKAPPPTPTPRPVEPVEHPPSRDRSWGWVAVGVGAAGVVTGSVMWAMAKGKQGDLEDAGCAGGRCPSSAASDLDTYNTLRTGTYLGFGLGAAGLITGAVLLVTEPETSDEPLAGMQPWVGARAAGVRGSF